MEPVENCQGTGAENVHVSAAGAALIQVEADDTSLVLRAQDGDVGAFASLVERHWPAMVRFARSIAGEGECEDCVQDAMIAAWSNITTLRQPHAFAGWLLRIVARRSFRRARRNSRWVSLARAGNPSSPNAGRDTGMVDVEQVLSRLAPRQRAVMHLTVIEEMTDSEIALALGITPASVRSHRRRAREMLNRVLTAAEVRAGK
jgi:RNA polymerase sigma-70 factor (ECF subfamily)